MHRKCVRTFGLLFPEQRLPRLSRSAPCRAARVRWRVSTQIAVLAKHLSAPGFWHPGGSQSQPHCTKCHCVPERGLRMAARLAREVGAERNGAAYPLGNVPKETRASEQEFKLGMDPPQQ